MRPLTLYPGKRYAGPTVTAVTTDVGVFVLAVSAEWDTRDELWGAGDTTVVALGTGTAAGDRGRASDLGPPVAFAVATQTPRVYCNLSRSRHARHGVGAAKPGAPADRYLLWLDASLTAGYVTLGFPAGDKREVAVVGIEVFGCADQAAVDAQAAALRRQRQLVDRAGKVRNEVVGPRKIGGQATPTYPRRRWTRRRCWPTSTATSSSWRAPRLARASRSGGPRSSRRAPLNRYALSSAAGFH